MIITSRPLTGSGGEGPGRGSGANTDFFGLPLTSCKLYTI